MIYMIHYKLEKESDLQPSKPNLSTKLSECLPNVLCVKTIERKAINLLSHPTAIVILSTTQVTAEEVFYLAVSNLRVI